MATKYSNDFKAMITHFICVDHCSTSETASKFQIPLKTVEKWVTAFHKDPHCFDSNYLSPAQQIDLLKKKIAALERDNDILKKTISLLAKKM